MVKRNKWVAGNWKMNLSLQQALDLVHKLLESLNPNSTVPVTLCVPALYLGALRTLLAANTRIQLAAQNCHQLDKGAYTGEISAAMLQSMAIPQVLVGHSERREHFGESGKILAEKVSAALRHQMLPIFCCGEPLDERERQAQIPFVHAQIRDSLFHLNEKEIARVAIAYEPVWAIGTGRTATAEQAQEMHAAIRRLIGSQFGFDVAEGIPILYGGSVNAGNAADLFAMADVDGGLVGGASLSVSDFLAIIEAAENI